MVDLNGNGNGTLDTGEDAPFAPDDQAQRDAIVSARWEQYAREAPAAWYVEPPAKRTWLLRDTRHPKARGVLPLGKVGQIIAPGGVGKTMTFCQLAVAVATGAPWLGALSIASPGRVLLVLGEEDIEEARRRLFRAARAGGGKAPEAGSIVVMPLAGVVAPMLETDKQGNSTETEFLHWLRDFVRAGDFRLVVIDPLSRFAGRDAEKDNAAATRFIQACESLASPTTSVLIAHHTNQVSRKAVDIDATAGRGVTGLVDGPRWQAAFVVEALKFDTDEEHRRLGEIVTFIVTKSNYAAKPEPIVLRRDQDNGGALLLVGDEDLEAIEEARRAGSDRAARRAERQSERSADVAERERAATAAREKLAGARGAEAAQRRAIQERALVAILRAHPAGLISGDVFVKLKAALGTLTKDEHKVVAERLGSAVERTKAPPPAHHSAVVWRLVESDLRPAPQVSPVSPAHNGLSPAVTQ